MGKSKQPLNVFRSALLIVGLLPSLSLAQATGPNESQRLNGMAEYLAHLQNFSYKVRAFYDVVQKDGQKIEFNESREVSVGRPDHIRADFMQGDGMEGTVLFDGKQFLLYNKTDNLYATTTTAGTVDDIVTTLSAKLGIQVPLAMLINSKLPELLRSKIRNVDLVESVKLDGVACDHVAARGDKVDLQVWIQQGEQPVPRRIVITYKTEQGMPQFRADLNDWQVTAARHESRFKFVIPAGVEQMEFHSIGDHVRKDGSETGMKP